MKGDDKAGAFINYVDVRILRAMIQNCKEIYGAHSMEITYIIM